MRSRKSTKEERGQVSFESILLWAGFLAVLGLFLPVFAHALEAQKLQLEKEQFLSFSYSLKQNLIRLSHYAEGSSISMRGPSIENLEMEIQENAIALAWSPPALSTSLTQEIESPLSLVGEWSPDSDDVVLSRESNTILIESG